MEGKEYVDGAVTAGMPNGAFVREPFQCQEACKAQVQTIGCKGFTWRNTPAKATAFRGVIGAGGCWLIGDKAVLMEVNATETPGRVVSGLPDCETAATGTSVPVLAGAPTATAKPTSAPEPSAAPEGAAPEGAATEGAATEGVATDGETSQRTAVNTTESATGSAATGSEEGSGGSNKTWLIVVAAIAVLGITAGACFMVCSSADGEKAVKKKKKDKKTRGIELEGRGRDVEATADQAPLLNAASEAAHLPPRTAAPTALSTLSVSAAPAVPAPPAMPGFQVPGYEARGRFSYIQPQGGPVSYPMAYPAGMSYMGQPRIG